MELICRCHHYTTLGQNYYGLRQWPTEINPDSIHRDITHSRLVNDDRDLPALPTEYWLTGFGKLGFRANDVQAWRTEQYRPQPRNPVHQPILDLSLLPHKHWLPTLERLPPADRQPNRAAEPDHGTIPPSLEQLRAGQLGRTASSGEIRVQQLRASFN